MGTGDFNPFQPSRSFDKDLQKLQNPFPTSGMKASGWSGDAAEQSEAEKCYRVLLNRCVDFAAQLDQASELALRVYLAGEAAEIVLDALDFHPPQWIVVRGTVSGKGVEVMLPVSLLSVMLLGVERPHPQEAKKDKGFQVSRRLLGEGDVAIEPGTSASSVLGTDPPPPNPATPPNA